MRETSSGNKVAAPYTGLIIENFMELSLMIIQ
jgi:hypothetical protein